MDLELLLHQNANLSSFFRKLSGFFSVRGSYLSKEKYSQNLRLEFFGQISDLELGTNRENFGIILNQHSHVFDDD